MFITYCFILFYPCLLAYIYVPVLQELDTFKEKIWNSHRIRQQKDTNLPSGVPDHIYSFPAEYGLEECGMLNKLFAITRQKMLSCSYIIRFSLIV